MPKYEDRQLQLIDLLDRFESVPSWKHVRDALGLIGRLKDDGAIFWAQGSAELEKWHQYNGELWSFINNLGQRRDSNGQDSETAPREFIQTFEHSERRMDQMLHQFEGDDTFAIERARIRDWMSLVFRACVYAITSSWIEDKDEEITATIRVNIISGERQETWNRTKMQVPRKYRAATKKF